MDLELNGDLFVSGTNSQLKDLETLKNLGTYTTASGTYTTAVWSAGTNTCVWTAPKTGLYIIWANFTTEDNNSKTYKQLQLKGTATRLFADFLIYQASSQSASLNQSLKGVKASMPVYAEQGQTIIPYIHTDYAGVTWNVSLFGLFIK